jgi:hypothetical protein
MLGFVIPFKAKEKSKDWARDCALLKRTIQSILNQQDPSFKCYVIYSDMPPDPITDGKIIWIHFPFPFVEIEQMIDKDKLKNNTQAHFFFDQGKRILYGCNFAKKDGCKYIMAVDADDLVSNRIAGFVNDLKSSENVGCYVNKGYMYTEGKQYLVKVPRQMNFINGSVNIIRADLIPEPDFNENKFENFNFFSSHGYLKERIEKMYQKKLKRVPFYGTIYILHDSSWSKLADYVNKNTLKQMIKKILLSKPISMEMKKEFWLYPVTLPAN